LPSPSPAGPTKARASRPNRRTRRAPEEPSATEAVLVETPDASSEYWFSVTAPVDLIDLRDPSRVVGMLEPGEWYLAKRREGDWVDAVTDSGLEGWVRADAVQPAPAGAG
jgi:hypothetical protein